MPAAEVNSYEFAFHILPTVAEGEVPAVFQALKDSISKEGGTIVAEEAPARFDLAYDIIKYLEGRNRKFTSAYFGWIRFTADPKAIEEIVEVAEGTKELLRHLLIKLNKLEEAQPFYFHEALATTKQVENIEVDEETAVVEVETETVVEETPQVTATEETATDTEDGEESKDKV